MPSTLRNTFLLIAIITIVFQSVQAQDSLKILSWNIQMLPSIVKAGGKAKRAKAIVNQLNHQNFDAIVFQELFHKRSRRIIRRGLTATLPYHTKILNKKFLALKTNGGVMIFSKTPLKETHEIRYSQRKGFDAWARKGALLVEVDFHGKPVQIIGTHLQAFSTQEILYSQYQEMSDKLLMTYQKPGVPQFICGDLNTTKNLPPKLPDNVTQEMINRLPRYPYMLHTLKAEDGDLMGEQQYTMDRPFNDLCIKRKDYRLLIDYILIRSNDTKLTIQRQVRIFKQTWSKKHQDLSDHYGLQATIHFSDEGD